ncbi:MAG: NUDIX domain-containing protein [Spirochaetales bacterium]|nr:NUDIX domain-containing protein [Spirochaetales bacterium]
MEQEILPLVNNLGKQVGSASRKECHSNPALLHPVVHLHVMHPEGKLFLQQRAFTKDLYPGLWDTAVGGHISDGEEIQEALFREGKEELGIDATGARFIMNYIWKNVNESEYVHVYILCYPGTVTLNPEEIKDGRFFTPEEIREMILKKMTTHNFAHEFQLLEENGHINFT